MDLVQAEISIGVHFCRDAMAEFEELAPAQLAQLQAHFLDCLTGGAANRERFLALQRGEAWNPRLKLDPDADEPAQEELARAVRSALEAYNRGAFGLSFTPSPAEPLRVCVQWMWRGGEFVPLYNYELVPKRSPGAALPSGWSLPWSDEARNTLGLPPNLQARYELEITYRLSL